MLTDRGVRISDTPIAGRRKYLKNMLNDRGRRKYLKKYAKLIGVSEFLTPLLLARENNKKYAK
jgi:hypothetical protein